MTEPEDGAGFRRALKTHHLFALSFGNIVGTAWITGLGLWLGVAGSLGSVAGFVLGGIVMLLIALCYARLAVQYPRSGGAIAYAYQLWGTDAAFAAGWFMLLVYVTAISFQTIAIAWLLEALVSPAARGAPLYYVAGEPVYGTSMLIAVAVGIGVAFMNWRGVAVQAQFQSALTFGKIAVALVFFAFAIPAGRLEYLEPYWGSDTGARPVVGLLAVFTAAPFFLSGFDVVPLAMGEAKSRTAKRAVYVAIVGSLVAAVAYYVLVIICGALLLPRQELLGAHLPAVAAFERAFDSIAIAKLVLLAGLLGVLTCWNASVFGAGRLLHAMGDCEMIPGWFGRLHAQHATPGRAVLVASALGLALLPMGKAVIVAVVNTSGMSMALVALVVCSGLLRNRSGGPLGIFAVAGAAAIVVMALYESWHASRAGIPVEWLVFLGWVACGIALHARMRRSPSAPSERDRRLRLLGF